METVLSIYNAIKETEMPSYIFTMVTHKAL